MSSSFHSHPERTPPESRSIEWLDAEPDARGAVILIHGLNNRPELMRPLAEELRKRGFHTGLLGLSGHCGERWARVDYETLWLGNLDAAITGAKEKYRELPLSIAGYSLGGTLILAALSRDNAPAIASTVLFAPAVSLTSFAKLLKYALPLRHLGMKLPAMAPKKWRAHDWTSLGAYHALGRLILTINPERLRSRKVCAILDPKDELVSYGQTVEWVKENDLFNFAIRTNSPDKRPKQFHMLVDPEERGERSWEALLEATLEGIVI